MRGVDAARASLALLDVSLGDLDAFVGSLHSVHGLDASGDISQYDYSRVEPAMTKDAYLRSRENRLA